MNRRFRMGSKCIIIIANSAGTSQRREMQCQIELVRKYILVDHKPGDPNPPMKTAYLLVRSVGTLLVTFLDGGEGIHAIRPSCKRFCGTSGFCGICLVTSKVFLSLQKNILLEKFSSNRINDVFRKKTDVKLLHKLEGLSFATQLFMEHARALRKHSTLSVRSVAMTTTTKLQ